MKMLVLFTGLLLFPAVLLFPDNNKPIVTVLDFSISQVSEQEAAILVDYFSNHLVSSGKYRVIDRSQRRTILSELEFSYDGCVDEQCQLEIGKLLAASYIFTGSLGKLGSRLILNMSLVDVETGEAVNSLSEKYENMDSIVDDTGRIIGIFTETYSNEPAAAQTSAAIPAPAAKTAVPAVSSAPQRKNCRFISTEACNSAEP